MSKYTVLCLCTLLSLAGCSGVIKVTPLDGYGVQLRRPSSKTVAVYHSPQSVDKSFLEIAVLTADASTMTPSLVDRFKAEASKIGAEGIILNANRERDLEAEQAVGPTHLSLERGVVFAIAIVFPKE